MSAHVIKAICRRIERRMGGGRHAAMAAGVSGGLWSQYCSEEHPTITIPTHRLLDIAAGDERRAVAALFGGDDGRACEDILTEASEVTEAAAALQAAVRRAVADGRMSPRERREIRDQALALAGEVDDVLKGAEG